MKQNFILIGSSSELAKEFSKLYEKNYKFINITSNSESSRFDDLIVKDYMKEYEKIINFIKNINNPIIIFFNGFLAENRPIYNPNIEEIQKTFTINYLFPYLITKKLIENEIHFKKLVFLSSFAASKIRKKNYIYGSCKLLLEKSICNLDFNNFLFIRFGKINTQFSSSHNKTIFDMKKEKAAKILFEASLNSVGVIYPTITIKIISIIIKILPSKIINFLKI